MFAAALYVLRVLDLYYCLWISDFPAPTNERKRLLLTNETFERLRVAELNQMQICIEQEQARNSVPAPSLNLLRGASPASQPVSLLVSRIGDAVSTCNG